MTEISKQIARTPRRFPSPPSPSFQRAMLPAKIQRDRYPTVTYRRAPMRRCIERETSRGFCSPSTFAPSLRRVTPLHLVYICIQIERERERGLPEGVARKRWRRVVMEFDIRIDALEEREGERKRRDSIYLCPRRGEGAINARETRIFHRYFQRLDLFSRGFPKVVLRVSFLTPSHLFYYTKFSAEMNS